MSIITLTTDLGTNDHYSGSVKGAILRQVSDAIIIDISHKIEPFDVFRAAFVLRNAWPEFPPGTQHMVSVNTLDSADTRFIYATSGEHGFISADNGLLPMVVDAARSEFYQVEAPGYKAMMPLRDIMVPAVARILKGEKPESFMKRRTSITELSTIQPVVQQGTIKGTVIYIDSYENVLVNITRELFDRHVNGREFTLHMRSDTIETLSQNYYDVPAGEKACFFSSTGFLEIAINKGKAAGLLGLRIGDPVQIDFQ